ncbi:MAG: peptidoglycan bridge formation glycyltransferase FemA/FemB family protein [Candidatus Saccharibacteria bacterium]|nr:peptidoglycan bridge formation glycyltransferase FemA/FemB family protein [Candidatus Saccharibacteria bacterium]
MTFEEISAEDFREFAKNSPYKSFMQTPEIAKYREENGWTAYFLAAKHGEEIKAATMLVAKPYFLGKSLFIAPGGPLLDLEDQYLTEFFIKSLKKYLKSHNGYELHISPYYEITERDRHGDLVENGFNHKNAIKNLKNLGFTEVKDASQPKYMYALDLNGKSAEELMKDFKSNTRGHIRKAEKMGVTVRELKKDELKIFKDITESTSKRREFEDKPLKYYEEMYDLFVPRKEAMFLVAEVSVDSRESGARQREDERRSPVATGRPDAARESIETPLSAAMFMLYGSEVVYLFSGSDEKYMKDYNAQYELQWHMIKYAAEKKFKRYNFYGIHGLPDDNQPDGVYEFKKGFGGQVLEYAGTWELPINQTFYQMYKALKKLKHRG